MKKKIMAIVSVLAMAISLFAITPDTASASSADYWLKVNTQANVINVYKKTDGQWKPFKVMLCSCGKKKTSTPIGSYSIKKKWRWHKLMGGVSGQYVSQFHGNYLFHSVIYSKNKKPNKCVRSAYNKLGTNASHGCIRLATMDAKWIYENCKKGTKVTTYRSGDPGPLGKPTRVSMAGKGKRGWDPTDIISKNKNFRMTGPAIVISKESTIECGQPFNIKAGVTAKSPYTFQNLTSSVKVDKVEYQAYNDDPEATNPFVNSPEKTVDTTQAGTYRITYSCYDKYCGRKAVTKVFTLIVEPEHVLEEPVSEPERLQEPVNRDQQVETENPLDITDLTDSAGSN